MPDTAKFTHHVVGNGRTDGAVDLEDYGLRRRRNSARQVNNARAARRLRAAQRAPPSAARMGRLLGARRAELGDFAAASLCYQCGAEGDQARAAGA